LGGWPFVVAYCVACVLLTWVLQGQQRQTELDFDAKRVADLRLDEQRRSEELEQARIASRDAHRRLAEVMHAVSLEVLANIRLCPRGFADESVPAGEMLLMPVNEDVELFEPRVRTRGETPVQTTVDVGAVVFTDKAIRFFGSLKTVEWRLDRLRQVNDEIGHLTFAMANRKTVSGIGGDEELMEILRGGVLWSEAAAKGMYPDLASRQPEHRHLRLAKARSRL